MLRFYVDLDFKISLVVWSSENFDNVLSPKETLLFNDIVQCSGSMSMDLAHNQLL